VRQLVLPLGIVGALVFLILCFVLSRLVLSRAGQPRGVSALTGVASIFLGAVALLLAGGSSKHDIALERQALDARGIELLTRVAVPGSPLACLDGGAGEMVESSCEKLLFASPETTAAAVAYVSAQLALLADYMSLRRRTRGDEPAGLVSLRRGIEADRFGLVAQVLSARDGCTPVACESLALLEDASRVRANLRSRPFASHVARYAADWSTGPAASALAAVRSPDGVTMPMSGPVADASAAAPSPPTPASPPTPTSPSPARPLRKDIFLPSASSIPPVSIMTAEPADSGGAEAAGAKTGSGTVAKNPGTAVTSAGPAPKDAGAPARKPARSADQGRPSLDSSATRAPSAAASSQQF
jgi:hypothetical protein